MSLKAIYQRFLDNPNPISLSDNASLHYVTTLTSYHEPAGIIRHLETQSKKIVKTKSNNVISAVEGHDALAIEVETVLEFISGGGAYLPGLENFVVDKIATIPTVSHAARPEMRKPTNHACRHISSNSLPTTRSRGFAFSGTRDHYSSKQI